MCGRSHSLYDAYSAIEALHAAGPPSWSLDLMSGCARMCPASCCVPHPRRVLTQACRQRAEFESMLLCQRLLARSQSGIGHHSLA